jgi:hypothetical protein
MEKNCRTERIIGNTLSRRVYLAAGRGFARNPPASAD